MDAQLFDRQGQYVTTIKLPEPVPHMITWNGRYFYFDGGRFVEGVLHASTEAQR